jgi:hypothetical protein
MKNKSWTKGKKVEVVLAIIYGEFKVNKGRYI